MNFDIQTIPHSQQRYNTAGDYWETPGGTAYFRISEMEDMRYEWLCLIHEFVEYILVKLNNISLEEIDKFDMEFEKNRQEGNMDEPGDDPAAPYFTQHQMATVVERLCALFFGVLWKDYENSYKKP